MRFFLLGMSLAILIFSCADLEKSNQLNQLKKLERKVDSLKIMLIELNNESFRNAITKNEKKLREISDYLALDTLTEKDARLMDSFSSTNDSSELLLYQMEDLTNQIVEQKRSIINLKSDISNGFGKRNKYDEYIRFELKNYNLIQKIFVSCRHKKELLLIKLKFINNELSVLKNKYSS